MSLHEKCQMHRVHCHPLQYITCSLLEFSLYYFTVNEIIF